MGRDRLSKVVGFGASLLVLAALLWVIGLEGVQAAVVRADRSVLGIVALVALFWMSAWGLALWTVLGALETPVSPIRAVAVYAGAIFSNNVTPFGQAGGEPFAAFLISRAADSDYESGLAAIASVDAMHFVPSVGFAIVGFSFVLAGDTPLTRDLLFGAGALGVLMGVVCGAAYLGWRHRDGVERAIRRLVTPVVRLVVRFVPGREPPTAADVGAHVDTFFTAVDRVAADRNRLLIAIGFSAAGWLALATGLWLSLYALGHAIPLSVPLFVVPVAAVASASPLPGGLGGVEAAQVALLVPTAGLAPPVATAGVLIYRGATYWLPTVVGGGAVTMLGVESRR